MQLPLFPNTSKQEVILGDCLEVMKTFSDNSIDCIVTDPPYGLHFMGKNWDYGIPNIIFWQEMLRICKPGAMLLAFGGTRTFHRLTCMIEDAGWEIRDVIMWLYGSGFPKSHNFGRKLSEEWHGYGTALKPAYEPIIIAMKPCDGTFAHNAEKWGVAGINIDECRIKIELNDDIYLKNPHTQNRGENKIYGKHTESFYNIPFGRWPANIILDEEAAKQLDEKSGILKSSSGIKNPIGGSTRGFHSSNWKDSGYIQGDSGGASRFFYCAKASASERNTELDGMPLKEAGIKNDSGRGFSENDPYQAVKYKNNHPTVKPLKLMEYLLKLVMPPNENAVVLDPFAGSGTTLLAAKNLHFNAIGIEKEKEYYDIAKARIENAE